MIYTVTFNPALDYVVELEALKSGDVNRSVGEEIHFGGKGVNVSAVLHQLGVKSVAMGFVAGFTGLEIERLLKEEGIETDFIRLKSGSSRINVKIKAEEETEINAQGPKTSDEEVAAFLNKLKKIQSGDTLILAGSVPKSLSSEIYETIIKALSEKDVRFVIDSTKELVLNTLKYRPFLIKPNLSELSEMVGKPLSTDEEIINSAKILQEKGAQNVLVSMAGDGAILVARGGEVLKISAAKGVVINSVGAGDSMVAGFIAAIEENKGYEDALRLATSCGGATAFSKRLCEKEKIYELYSALSGAVTKL